MEEDRLEVLSEELLHTWNKALLAHQVNEINSTGLKGGLLSPAYARIEGRCAETVYPFLFWADKKKDHTYLDASVQLMNWAENNVIFPDGSWVNEVSVSDWRGITVNAVIALAEALFRHGHILEKREYDRWLGIVSSSAEYVYKTFDLGFGNINYPVVTTYALTIAGQLLNEKKYLLRANDLAGKILPFFTSKNHLLFGEGKPYDLKSPKGCYALDLGYNVEESLPALVLYGILSGNNEMLDVVTESLKSHLEFMLPDGAWDNSWGTRNYKWTWWGSRNSDGCQPAYALLVNRHPGFYEAAVRNTQLLKNCTHNGLLFGGPHNAQHGELPSVHHTFCHAKALATILDYGIPEIPENKHVKLPREEEKGILEFSDIQTWLVSKGDYRATVTGYDREYDKNTHPSGGALSILWHTLTGPIVAASITDYRLLEPSNMQMDKDPFSMPLTPRLELFQNGQVYRSVSDLSAVIKTDDSNGILTFMVEAHLVNGAQEHPESGSIPVQLKYTFSNEYVAIEGSAPDKKMEGKLDYYLPVISEANEKYELTGKSRISVKKEKAEVIITSEKNNLSISETNRGRVFNFVPGFEALPVCVDCDRQNSLLFRIRIDVIETKTEK